jgi:hypothetical protein
MLITDTGRCSNGNDAFAVFNSFVIALASQRLQPVITASSAIVNLAELPDFARALPLAARLECCL